MRVNLCCEFAENAQPLASYVRHVDSKKEPLARAEGVSMRLVIANGADGYRKADMLQEIASAMRAEFARLEDVGHLSM